VESSKNFYKMSPSTKPQLSAIATQDVPSLVVDKNEPILMDNAQNEPLSAASPASSVSDASVEQSLNPRKRKHTLEDKDQKQRERILRNRAAAQDSRDRKRRYVTSLEATNEQLKEQNDELTKRLKTVETENELLTAQLRMFVTQLTQAQDQLRFNNITEFLLGGFRDSARVALRTPLPTTHD